MHPETHKYEIDMFYVESSKQSHAQQGHSYKDEGESFLSSLRFYPVRG
jgi:hypothetical protein